MESLQTPNPLVTCLCLTKDRREWLPKAIDCFLEQTYANRELLIVADGPDVSDLVPNDERIRLVHLDKSLTIGAKRNAGCELAGGEIICHFDDDDHSAPQRITDQVNRLRASGKALTGYHVMRFTDGVRWYEYQGVRRYPLGTSLCYLREWWKKHQFHPKQVGEDRDFTDVAWNAGQSTSEPAGLLMHATIHPGNTSRRDLTKGQNYRLIA